MFYDVEFHKCASEKVPIGYNLNVRKEIYCRNKVTGDPSSTIQSIQFRPLLTSLVSPPHESITFQVFDAILKLVHGGMGTPTFEINGHGASVWCHCSNWHLKRFNLCNLDHCRYFWFHYHMKTPPIF